MKIFEEIFSAQKKRIYNALLNSTSNEVNNFNNVIKNQQLEINQLQTGYYIVKVYYNKFVESRNLIKK